MLQRLTVEKGKANSDVAQPSAWLNQLFHGILDSERRWHLHFPFGGSGCGYIGESGEQNNHHGKARRPARFSLCRS